MLGALVCVLSPSYAQGVIILGHLTAAHIFPRLKGVVLFNLVFIIFFFLVAYNTVVRNLKMKSVTFFLNMKRTDTIKFRKLYTILTLLR